jgi:hypothetical protein
VSLPGVTPIGENGGVRRPIVVGPAEKVRDKRVRRWGVRRGWVVEKDRVDEDRPYRLHGAPHVPAHRALSIDELEELLGIG